MRFRDMTNKLEILAFIKQEYIQKLKDENLYSKLTVSEIPTVSDIAFFIDRYEEYIDKK